MDSQLDRINRFIDTLAEEKLLVKNALILTPDMAYEGGDNGTCKNFLAEACSGTNENCTNFKGVCGLTNNSECINGTEESNPE